MKMHSLLVRLHDLVDPATVLKMHDATIEDIELLAIVAEEIEKTKPQKEDNG